MFDQVLWFATRGAGAVSLLMFTASTALGLVTVARFQAAGWPRFFNYEMHRRVSLLSIVFLTVHVLAAVFDPFTKLGIGAALVPFASSYRPVQVALGVIALYLFVALIATSLLRKHIGQRTWRLVHWASYAMWPLALLHGITAGQRRLRAVDARRRPRLRGRGRGRASPGAIDGRQPEPRRASPEVVATSSWQARPAGRPMTARLLAGPALAAGPETARRHMRPARTAPRTGRAPASRPAARAAGLLGRGGAGFPVGRKWASVADRVRGSCRRPRQRCRGRAAERQGSRADEHAAAPRARRRGAGRRGRRCRPDRAVRRLRAPGRARALDRAMDERMADMRRIATRVPTELVAAPPTYVAGEESAAVHFVNDGRCPADDHAAAPVRARHRRPADAGPERREPRARGADRPLRGPVVPRGGSSRDPRNRARHDRGSARGPASPRSRSARRSPRSPRSAGAPVSLGPVLLGGYFGGWVAGRVRLAGAARSAGAASRRLGVRVRRREVPPRRRVRRPGNGADPRLHGGPERRPVRPVRVRPAGDRGRDGAPRQCGARTDDDLRRVSGWSETLAGRGACRHPDGAVGLLRSALRTFDDDFTSHQRGRGCVAGQRAWAAA